MVGLMIPPPPESDGDIVAPRHINDPYPPLGGALISARQRTLARPSVNHMIYDGARERDCQVGYN